MVEYNKVVNGLKHCTSNADEPCLGCPYWENKICKADVQTDALELLEAYKKEIEYLTRVCDDFMRGAMQ